MAPPRYEVTESRLEFMSRLSGLTQSEWEGFRKLCESRLIHAKVALALMVRNAMIYPSLITTCPTQAEIESLAAWDTFRRMCEEQKVDAMVALDRLVRHAVASPSLIAPRAERRKR